MSALDIQEFYRALKTDVDQNHDDILVFGYSCKIFRDDVKATLMDSGGHLMPWMGDSSVMIDRYDCRLHLTDLREFEARTDDTYIVPEDEREVEILCDQERYYDLLNAPDIHDVVSQAEEDIKRRQAASGLGSGKEFHFTYSDSTKLGLADENSNAQNDEGDQPYVQPDGLKLPPDMLQPHSSKIHAIIERTAVFVLQNGPQMEIVIKARQAGNRQFDFLNYDNELNPYYKFVMKMIKEKRYVPTQVEQSQSDSDQSGSDDENDGYLHPSLMVVKTSETAAATKVAPTAAPYKLGQENDVYSQLFNRLSGMAVKVEAAETVATAPPAAISETTAPSTSCGDEQQMWSWYYRQSGVDYSRVAQNAAPPPPDLQPIIDRMAEYVARQGPEFEQMVRRREDPRFDFVNTQSPYYPYYQLRVAHLSYRDYMKQYFDKLAHMQFGQLSQPQSCIPLPASPPVPPSSQFGAVRDPIPVATEALSSDETAEPAARKRKKLKIPVRAVPVAELQKLPLQKSAGPISFALKAKECNEKVLSVTPAAALNEDVDDDGEARQLSFPITVPPLTVKELPQVTAQNVEQTDTIFKRVTTVGDDEGIIMSTFVPIPAADEIVPAAVGELQPVQPTFEAEMNSSRLPYVPTDSRVDNVIEPEASFGSTNRAPSPGIPICSWPVVAPSTSTKAEPSTAADSVKTGPSDVTPNDDLSLKARQQERRAKAMMFLDKLKSQPKEGQTNGGNEVTDKVRRYDSPPEKRPSKELPMAYVHQRSDTKHKKRHRSKSRSRSRSRSHKQHRKHRKRSPSTGSGRRSRSSSTDRHRR